MMKLLEILLWVAVLVLCILEIKLFLILFARL